MQLFVQMFANLVDPCYSKQDILKKAYPSLENGLKYGDLGNTLGMMKSLPKADKLSHTLDSILSLWKPLKFLGAQLKNKIFEKSF